MTELNVFARHRARRLAMQALYQWQISGTEWPDLLAQFHTNNDLDGIDTPFFDEVVKEVIRHQAELDASFEAYLDRPISELNPVELALIRMGSYELLHRMDVPHKVVINEALDLAKAFGSTDGHKYVNAVLDKLAKKVRTA